MKLTASKLLESAYRITVFLAFILIASLPFRTPARDIGPLVQNTSTNAFSVVWWHKGDETGTLSLHDGDLVYGKGEAHDYPKKFFWTYRELISRLPFYPVLGNHDVTTDNGQPFLDTFTLVKDEPSDR